MLEYQLIKNMQGLLQSKYFALTKALANKAEKVKGKDNLKDIVRGHNLEEFTSDLMTTYSELDQTYGMYCGLTYALGEEIQSKEALLMNPAHKG